jgi:hypothetical protein
MRQDDCGRGDAQARFSHAEEHLRIALETSVKTAAASANAAASSAVLAGIAAADAICCARLGRRSRSQDHRDAVRLLEQVEPDGRRIAESLRRLLDLKDSAEYGVASLGAARVKTAVRQATALVDAARDALRS